jgi:hypothetical protein
MKHSTECGWRIASGRNGLLKLFGARGITDANYLFAGPNILTIGNVAFLGSAHSIPLASGTRGLRFFARMRRDSHNAHFAVFAIRIAVTFIRR